MQIFKNNTIALVTGAGAGIGKSIALKLASFGATVVVSDVRLEAAEDTVRELPVNGKPHRAIALDVTNRQNVEQVFKEIVSTYGTLDILINNAGVSTMNTIENLTEKEWDFNFDVNLKGVFFCTQAAIPYMKNQGSGKIVNTASMAGKRGVPLLAHYAASKWGVIGFTKSAAMELAPHGITVNCVCPGYVKTSMQERELEWEAELRQMTQQEVKDEYIRNTPLGRLCTADDVAKAVGFLVSPEADFITGEALDVTGGADLV
ncbi:SDR family NAD(P)-dependent oxidoreductase [Cohnella silvisoli]|uniref:SDR family NAD(P)-dependent oxidoreductase n=1 Tax=Cohnella silvisoli TaxID=2873699 RepID=A0ABV1KPP2_9BACL|nr:SDR family NAD(P)-dependent oxidoreductase [Cohnella silvisoli]MCD9020959.1 SDR family oxidoreductase [Cohnella silvisoli]